MTQNQGQSLQGLLSLRCILNNPVSKISYKSSFEIRISFKLYRYAILAFIIEMSLQSPRTIRETSNLIRMSKECPKLLAPSSRNPDELVSLAAQLKEKGRIDEALCNLNEAIRLRPEYAEAHSQRAMLLWQKKLLDEALYSFSEAIKYARRSSIWAPLWYNKGLILTETQRYEEAIAYFDEAISLYGSFYGSYNNKGVALGLLGKH